MDKKELRANPAILEAAARAVVVDGYTTKQAINEYGVLYRDLAPYLEEQRRYLDPIHIERREKLKRAFERLRRC